MDLSGSDIEEDGRGGKGDIRPFVDVAVGKTREIAGRVFVMRLRDAGSVSLGLSNDRGLNAREGTPELEGLVSDDGCARVVELW